MDATAPAQRRSVLYPGARNRLIPQPIGVVGVIVPWNYPIFLSFGPLTGALAAGNRAMVKMSENSQALVELLAGISPKYLPEDKLAFFADGGGRGPAFSSLPFDYLFFTGSGTTGRAVMANAARNLTPVTLELGGKSPAIVAPDYPIATAAERILWAKTFNAGQTCVAVDYAFVPRGSEYDFVNHCRTLFARRYPDINGPDFTSIIDQRSYDRLTAALDDARAKGARLVNLAEGQTPDKSKRRLAPHIVLNVTPEMELMRREIFGPILPVLTYSDLQEVVDAINSRDRPLALYPFVRNAATRRFLIANTRSGGVSVIDAILHVVQHDLPFGGVGPSGIGHYHGREGFEDFLQAQAGVRGRLDFGGADLHAAALYALFPPHHRPHGVDEKLTGLHQFRLSGFRPGGVALSSTSGKPRSPAFRSAGRTSEAQTLCLAAQRK